MVICFKLSQNGIQWEVSEAHWDFYQVLEWVKTNVEAYPLLGLNGPHVLSRFPICCQGILFVQVLETSMIGIWDISKVKTFDFGRVGCWITHSLHCRCDSKKNPDSNDQNMQKISTQGQGIIYLLIPTMAVYFKSSISQ